MNVLLISECNKNALKETRRILDQFAERRGERTWQTSITYEGLKTLRRLLRKTARRNTAVACHWIRGLDHSELMWVVGNASRFSVEGAVPTNTTTRDVLRRQDENDWHTGEAIYLLSALAALLHDLGKACKAFQDRLKGKGEPGRNLYRHEWISVRLFQAFVGDDDDAAWLQRLIEPDAADDARWLDRLQKDSPEKQLASPFTTLPPLAAAVAWLVLTHHRLPVKPEPGEQGGFKFLGGKTSGFSAGEFRNMLRSIVANWNEICEETDPAKLKPYWTFPHGLPVAGSDWRKRAARLAKRLLSLQEREKSPNWLENPYVMHLSRLSLMLADHHFSSIDLSEKAKCSLLYANTIRETGAFNQTLDEHLLGVAVQCGHVTYGLPDLENALPRLARHRGLRKRSQLARFRWQDKAADLAASVRDRTLAQGAFFVNMASTGCGKTLANARIMYALAEPDRGARFSIALGLRVLTLQTGQAYQEKLGLGEDELAIRVGGSASRALFEYHQEQASKHGSESTQELFPEDDHVLFEGDFDSHPVLQRILHNSQIKALISAPVLACTVDHLVPATESQRGGRQIAPMLRLMSSDLVLDEIDDFDLADLPALARLVHWAGMLGSRVMLSSATLPPALVQCLFDAYHAGRTIYQQNRGELTRPVDICCAWIDEHGSVSSDCANSEVFQEQHRQFVTERAGRLAKDSIRRSAELLPLALEGKDKDALRQALAEQLLSSAIALHQQHSNPDPRSQKRVSFGLLRMANIEPMIDVALAMYRLGAPEGYRIHLCVYHSQYPLLIRSEIEKTLDAVLDRRDPAAVFTLPDIRQYLDRHQEEQHVFIVLGSPVTEVGRDHDYDWAVVEPSSMRSLIQLAGRIRRHRPEPYELANIHLLSRNLKSFESPGKPAFIRPGFETDEVRLNSHDLQQLLEQQEWEVIDARPRILQRPPGRLRAKESLVDLEHARLTKELLPEAPRLNSRGRQREGALIPLLGAHSWWTAPNATLTGVLPQQQPFRENSRQEVDLVLLPDEDEEGYQLHKIHKASRYESVYVLVEESLHQRIPDSAVQGTGIAPWGEVDYMSSLLKLAEEKEQDLQTCSKQFGTVRLSENMRGWRFHPALGFGEAT